MTFTVYLKILCIYLPKVYYITAEVELLLLSNKLILNVVLYCNFFCKMANVEIVNFDAFGGDRQNAVLIVNQ